MKMEKRATFERKSGNNKGFTLIEMAIVLVIIGIIIGAVVKGQDLIANAQAKQVISGANSWRSLAYAFLDRNGRLPGDGSRNGIIGDALPAAPTPAETADTGSSIAELVNTMQNAPVNPLIIGSMSFWAYFGNVPATVGTRNAIVICKDAACATVFTADELETVKALDTALDGTADAGLGQVRGATAVTVSALAGQGTPSRTNGVVTTVTVANVTGDGATAAWAPVTAYKAAVWAFDRPY